MIKLIALLAAGAAIVGTPLRADPLADAVKADMPGLTAIYRDFHMHPELSFKEGRSAGIMAAEAKKAGFEVTSGVGGTGCEVDEDDVVENVVREITAERDVGSGRSPRPEGPSEARPRPERRDSASCPKLMRENSTRLSNGFCEICSGRVRSRSARG